MWHIFYYFDIFHLNKWVYSHWLVSRHDTGTLCKYLTLVFLSWESSARQELKLDLQILSSDLRHVIHYLSYNISQAYSVHMDIQFVSILLFCETGSCCMTEIQHHLGSSTSILKIQAGATKSIFYSGFLNHYFTHLFLFLKRNPSLLWRDRSFSV